VRNRLDRGQHPDRTLVGVKDDLAHGPGLALPVTSQIAAFATFGPALA
jgi:hypothetical protein